MRLVTVCLLLLVARDAHAEIGLVMEGGFGKVHSAGYLGTSTELGGRAAYGARGKHFGGELVVLGSDLGHDEMQPTGSGFYSSLTFGPMFTARQVFGRTRMDKVFERWLELYGRAGPTYTYVRGDPGDGPLDGVGGYGFAAGGGLRYVWACLMFSLDVTYARATVARDGKHDLADELHQHDVPAFARTGSQTFFTFGFGFAL